MEEKIQAKKRSKTFLLLLIIILIGLGFFYYKFYLIKDINKEEKAEKVEPPTSNDLNALYHDYERCDYDSLMESEQYIFLNDEVIYECQSNGEYGCYATTIDDFEYCNTTDSLIMITDDGKDLIYDYKNKKVVLEVDYFNNILYSDHGFMAYFVFEKDGKVGLATMEGKVVIEPIYDDISLGNPVFEGEYSLKNNVVAAEKDGKVGVLEITTGKEVIPFNYNYIRIYANNYVLVGDENISLTDLELNTILDGNFNDMIVVDEVAFVENNKVISFYDLKGNKLVEDTVEIIKPYDNSHDRGFMAYSMDQFNEVITIEVFTEDGEYYSCYNLHVKEKRLEKFNCSEMGE